MTKRITLLALYSMLLTLCSTVAAQKSARIPRIGHLNVPAPTDVPERYQAFREGLRELGYIDGKNIVIEYRYAEGKLDRLPFLAAELVRLGVDVIVTGGPTPTRAAKKATNTIPIVMAFDSDPVGNGFVSSLARPGGNITGLSNVAPEISGKRLELLKEIVPNLSRVAVLGMSNNPGNSLSLKETELAAQALGLRVKYLDVRNSKVIKRKLIVTLAAKARLPTIYFESRFVREGGLVSYGASLPDLDRRSAAYVDKILRGAKPADLPVEQPTKFEFVINLNAAKQIGLAVSPNVLARADAVIR
jgi:putative ABC transport system substrate-binding protein